MPSKDYSDRGSLRVCKSIDSVFLIYESIIGALSRTGIRGGKECRSSAIHSEMKMGKNMEKVSKGNAD